ncbi:MACPF domain-containing protein [Chryseobacterium sp. SSA4.19]|uniref:MAC/perforin domain-containing protein n=1 Tax=Chryseobacterium sp. SSA4.19 TaxID=2919915 RepID=UPI001F4E12C6|nr:MAC/perforin domain-containing protein [Chryseobacterium sp. SSA4.19]MCJ8153616.1 MACPF domain-containing protein [Chryseobacterium sp. SSA4.19]
MKKTTFISFALLAGLSLLSCSADEIILEENTENFNHTSLPIHENSKQFGYYNALGYGYNVTGEYANANATGLKVIDTDKFKAEHPSRLDEGAILSQEYTEEYGQDATAYSKVLSEKVTATQLLRMYGKSISSPFTSALSGKNFNPEYIYGNYNITIKQKRYRFNATVDLLSNYITSNFSQDIQSKTPEQIVNEYGTHVATDIYTGAKIDIVFQAKTTNPDRDRAARIGVKTASGTINTSGTNDIDALEASKNYDKKLYYRTRGGNSSEAMAGIFSFSKEKPTINISKWQSTSTKENSVLVDFGSDGLIIIYDLVKDPVKRAELKLYIDEYLIKNQVILAS